MNGVIENDAGFQQPCISEDDSSDQSGGEDNVGHLFDNYEDDVNYQQSEDNDDIRLLFKRLDISNGDQADEDVIDDTEVAELKKISSRTKADPDYGRIKKNINDEFSAHTVLANEYAFYKRKYKYSNADVKDLLREIKLERERLYRTIVQKDRKLEKIKNTCRDIIEEKDKKIDELNDFIDTLISV